MFFCSFLLEEIKSSADLIFEKRSSTIDTDSFTEEKRSGTIELLLTKPLSDVQIIMAKYFAGLLLVIISLIPTLIFYITIYQLGSPVGNIDSGGNVIGRRPPGWPPR